MAKICGWHEQVMELEGLINHRRLEGLEDVLRVRKQIQRHREWVGQEGRREGSREVTCASRVLEVEL